MTTTYVKLHNNNPIIETLEQFVDFFKIRIDKEKKKEKKKDKNGKEVEIEIGFTIGDFFEENRESLFSQLSEGHKREIAKKKAKKIADLTSKDINKDIKLPCPVYLLIKDKYISYSVLEKDNSFQVSESDTIAFQDSQIQSVLNNTTSGGISGAKRLYPTCRVIGWFKSMYFEKKNNEKNNNLDNIYDLKQTFLDLSKYVLSLSTSVTGSGGNFQITLPHVPLYVDNINSSMFSALSERGNAIMFDKNFQANTDENIKSSISAFSYFEWLIQSNDLLFISFDEMKDLKDDSLAGHNFDMIGLIDSVSISKNATGQVNIDIIGRDLMKIITEDSSIFFYQGVSSGEGSAFKGFDNTITTLQGGDKDSIGVYKGAMKGANGATRQLNGNINIFACEPNDFSIEFVLKTVVSHLANMSIVPDDLFISWGDKRTKFKKLKTTNVEDGK